MCNGCKNLARNPNYYFPCTCKTSTMPVSNMFKEKTNKTSIVKQTDSDILIDVLKRLTTNIKNGIEYTSRDNRNYNRSVNKAIDAIMDAIRYM